MSPVMWPRMRDDYEPGSADPGQSLVKSSSQDAWEPGAEPGGGGGGASALADLTDVDLTGAADGDTLVREGGAWVARSGTSGSGLAPDPDYPGYYVISEGGGDPGTPVDYPPTITLGVSTDGLDATATFAASDPEGDPITVSIDWGDGSTTSPATSPAAHTYAASGEYTITATATANGKTGTDTAHVEVAPVVGPGSYSAAVLADSPVVYIPFSETELPFNDVQGNATLTVVNSAPIPEAYVMGSLTRAAKFDVSSADAAYNIGNPIAGASAASVEVIVRPWQLGLRKIMGAPSIILNTNGAVRVWGGSAWVDTPAGVIATGGPVHHLAVTWSGAAIKVYVNGSEELSAASAYTPMGVSAMVLGGTDPISQGDNFQGWLAGFALYDKVLAPTEVLDHAAAAGLTGV